MGPDDGVCVLHIKGNDVTNVEWEPETRVLSFNLTRQAQRSIVNQN